MADKYPTPVPALATPETDAALTAAGIPWGTQKAVKKSDAKGCEFCIDPDGNLCFPSFGIAPHVPTEPNGIRGHQFVEPRPEDGFIPDPDDSTVGIYYCTHCGCGKPEEPPTLTLAEKAARVATEPDCLSRVDYGAWPMAQDVARAYVADLAAREAEEGSRAVRIDEAWLQSIGFVQSVGELVIESVWHLITVDTGKVKLFNRQTMQSVTIGWSVSTTRGMMLDFLAGLKIPVKSDA